MKVLLVSEGASELGGALQTIVERLMSVDCEFVTEKAKNIPRMHGKGGQLFKKAVQCLYEAGKRECDALVFVVDEDGEDDRIEQLERAQQHFNDAPSDVRGAVGIAIRAFDAWMLADEKALGIALGQYVPKQRRPETNNRPKQDCGALLDRSSIPYGNRPEFYREVARTADFDVWRNRCPRGFGRFAERVDLMADA
jgi:hypothetical protein